MRIHSLVLLCLCTATVNAAQPIIIDNERDQISYSLGYQIGGDFKRQNLDINAAAVVRGIEDALTATRPQMEEPTMRKTLVELKRKIVETQQTQKTSQAHVKHAASLAFLKENGKKDGVITLPSGLQYKVIKPGTGTHPTAQDNVTVHYRGTLVNGHEFDSSYRRNEPASFAVIGVIRGWTEALQLMAVGAKWELFIPPELAYGERGPLADETLIFEVELLSITESNKSQPSSPASSIQK
jgi:FKBP-type peptidyl-prolyl cis-trans isomerase FklB